MYETIYLTVHKGPCRAAAFSNDGKLEESSGGNSAKLVENFLG